MLKWASAFGLAAGLAFRLGRASPGVRPPGREAASSLADSNWHKETGTMKLLALVLIGLAMVSGCAAQAVRAGRTFADDLALLQKHGGAVVLADESGQAQVAVVPRMQGRVMTSTAEGDNGLSFGWINRELIASGKTLEHFNPLGGEDRFWLGPEGGQFSIYFGKGVPFDLAHWYVPAAIDTEPWEVVNQGRSSITLGKRVQLTNYSGARFEVDARREVQLLTPQEVWKRLSLAPVAGVKMVAFESVNQIANAGKEPWKKETGLLSIWVLGMFTPSPTTTVVIPIKPGPDSQLGPKVKDDYFGKVPAERLVAAEGVLYFSADGKCRSKIGIGPRRVKPIAGSYDAANGVLTLVQFTLPEGVTDYVNSMWQIQKDPYGGDVANSYNDGPAAPGAKPMGPFYELESSSPAAALEPGKSLRHVHRTIHLRGPRKDLDAIAKATLDVGIDQIVKALPR